MNSATLANQYLPCVLSPRLCAGDVGFNLPGRRRGLLTDENRAPQRRCCCGRRAASAAESEVKKHEKRKDKRAQLIDDAGRIERVCDVIEVPTRVLQEMVFSHIIHLLTRP